MIDDKILFTSASTEDANKFWSTTEKTCSEYTDTDDKAKLFMNTCSVCGKKFYTTDPRISECIECMCEMTNFLV